MTSPSERSWPELGQELSRKSVDQMQRITRLYDLGKITQREAALSLDVLVEAVHGLVPEDCWQTLYAVLKEVKTI